MEPLSEHGPDHEPARSRPNKLLWFLVVVGLVAIACVGGAVLTAFKVGQNLTPEADTGPARPAVAGSGPTRAAEEEKEPQASTYPVRNTDDLKRVCEHWYYPTSPKVQAGALNPVKAFTSDVIWMKAYTESQLQQVPWRATAAVRAAWDPPAIGKVRLVACVDRTGAGAKVKSCKFNDPKPDTVAMKRGAYTLSLYEVATGRTVTTKKLKGEDTACPFIAMIGADRTIYSNVSTRQIFETLRSYVEK